MDKIEVPLISYDIHTELNVEGISDLNYFLVFQLQPFFHIQGHHLQLILEIRHDNLSGGVQKNFRGVLW